MEAANEKVINGRMKAVLSQIVKLSAFDCSGRIQLAGNGDEIDAIAAGLNTLAEELDARIAYVKHNEERINDIMAILMEYTVMNFSRKMTLSDKADEIDAISAGLNTLAEELEYSLSTQKKYASQLEEANGKLEGNLNKLQAIFDHAPDAIIVVGMDLTILEWNKAAEKMYGYLRSEVTGKQIERILITEYLPDFSRDRILEEVKAKGSWQGEFIQYTEKQKEKMILSSAICYLTNQKGEPIGYLGVNHDITAMRRAEEEIKLKSEELKRSNAELEQFAYVASHDLQEPLRMITSYVQLLEKRYAPKLDSDAIEFINFAVDGAARMQTLIQSLLEYSRVNRVKPFEDVNLNDSMAEVLHDLGVAVAESKAQVNFKDLPTVYGDKVLLGQLFLNLVANAVKFRGERPVKIDIACKESEEEYLFSVKDNGIGIQKEYQEKIFVIFQRLHSKEKYPGTGIGLAICKKIVERHKGRIWVESEFGEGSVFYFTIKKFKKGQGPNE